MHDPCHSCHSVANIGELENPQCLSRMDMSEQYHLCYRFLNMECDSRSCKCFPPRKQNSLNPSLLELVTALQGKTLHSKSALKWSCWNPAAKVESLSQMEILCKLVPKRVLKQNISAKLLICWDRLSRPLRDPEKKKRMDGWLCVHFIVFLVKDFMNTIVHPSNLNSINNFNLSVGNYPSNRTIRSIAVGGRLFFKFKIIIFNMDWFYGIMCLLGTLL